MEFGPETPRRTLEKPGVRKLRTLRGRCQDKPEALAEAKPASVPTLHEV